MFDRSLTYILNRQGDPEPCADILTWGRWFEHDERRITRQQSWQDGEHEVFVSTVFVGVDHGLHAGPPVLWESMVFIDGEITETCRYVARDEAIIGHGVLVARYGGVVLE